MHKIISLYFILILSFHVKAQEDKVFLDIEKYTCNAGDTVYFKGFVTLGLRPSVLSTNLYIQVYAESGQLLMQDLFPIYEGHSFGQIIFNDSIPTDNYYIVAFTREQLNFDTMHLFSVPVTVINKSKSKMVYHKKKVSPLSEIVSGEVKGVSWTTKIEKDNLSVLLEIDSGSSVRRLHLAKRAKGDTSLMFDVLLNDQIHQRNILMPIDFSNDMERLYLYEDTVLIGRQFIRTKVSRPSVEINPDTLDLSPGGYNSWNITLPDSMKAYCSIVIADADKSAPAPLTIDHLQDSYTEDMTIPVREIDSSFIKYTGSVTTASGKMINGNDYSGNIFVEGMMADKSLFTKIVHVDKAGEFVLDSLFFFDHVDLQFHINQAESVKLHPKRIWLPAIPPPFFQLNWEDDEKVGTTENDYYQNHGAASSGNPNAKMLQSVTVKGRKDPRTELDHLYTTGAFSEPALYAYDFRDDSLIRQDIGSLLVKAIPRLYYNLLDDEMNDPLGHPIHYYLDEQEVSFWVLETMDPFRIAYIKGLESDFLSNEKAPGFSPKLNGIPPKTSFNILVYTRKGTDYKYTRNPKKSFLVKGYSPLLKFNPDKVTLYWNPLITGNRSRVMFHNTDGAKRFRIRVSGIDNAGKIVADEKIVE